jgi:predicted flap endonuclease-1-like 5' DNA nuclease
MYKTVRNITVLGLGLSASALVGWLLLRENKRDKEANVTVRSYLPESEGEIPQIVLPMADLEDEPEDAGVDDLTLIHDIGPRFAAALHAIGITQFRQLAGLTPEELSERLAPQVKASAQRIRERDWIGQAAQLSGRA